MAKTTLWGEKALKKKLKSLDRQATTIALAGTRKGVQALAKAMKKDVPARFKEARKGIGWKATRGRAASKYNGVQAAIAKAGVGVGIKRGKRLNKLFQQIKRQDDKAARGGKPGIGIGKFNFHWWIQGTKSRKTKSGANRGGTRAMLPGFAAKAASKSRGAVARGMGIEIKRQIQKKARKAFL